MGSLFNLDSPIMVFLGKLFDVVYISLLWLLFSLPIITIGASTTALYYVTVKSLRQDRGYIFQEFFKSFRQNFKQGTVIWILLILLSIVFYVDIQFADMRTDQLGAFLSLFFRSVILIAICISVYIFPVLSRFENTVLKTLINSALISIKHLPSTFLIVIIFAIVSLAIYIIPITIVILPCVGMLVASYLFERIFQKYTAIILERQQEQDSEE